MTKRGEETKSLIFLKNILPREININYPICIKGKRACPPEDCGGIWGHGYFLEIIRNPNHEEKEEMLEWVDGQFDSEHFDDPNKRRKMAFG